MSFNMDVKMDIKEVTRYLDNVQKKAVPKAAARAINRTAQQVRTQAVKDIAKEAGLKQKKVRESVAITTKARRTNLFARVEAKPKGVNLIEFVSKAKQTPGAFRKKPGVIAKAWGKRKTYRGTFIGRGKGSGKSLVFARTGKSRQSIKTIKGPSIPRTFVQDKVMTVIKRVAKTRWPINFNQDLKYYLSKIR